MHNIFYTTGVTSNEGKQLVKSGRLGSKDEVHNGVKKSEIGRKGSKMWCFCLITPNIS